MSTPVVFNGVTYNVPSFGDGGYAQGAGNLSLYLIALANSLPNTGGTITGSLTIAGTLTFNPTTNGIVGTTTNDNAATGIVGEYISSVVSATAVPGGGLTGDLTTISLTPGDWEVTALANYETTGTWTNCFIGITPHSGASNVGLVEGNNALFYSQTASATPSLPISISAFRISLNATTSYYLKFGGSFSTGTMTAAGRLSARRMR